MTRPTPGEFPVGAGTAELLGDADHDGGWMLLVDGTPQSHVDLDDPTYLDFGYIRRIGHAIDLAAPDREPLDAVHLGAGALTLARYVAVTRPGSRQRAVDNDAALADLVRTSLPLPRGVRVPVRIADAREAVGLLRSSSADVVVCDVFRGARTPAAVTSVEFLAEVARVLKPTGMVAVNVGDGPPLPFARAFVATLQQVFAHIAVVAEPGVLRLRRFGNVVCLASAAPLRERDLVRRAAGDPQPARVVTGPAIERFVAGAKPITDAHAVDSPAPPPDLFG